MWICERAGRGNSCYLEPDRQVLGVVAGCRLQGHDGLLVELNLFELGLREDVAQIQDGADASAQEVADGGEALRLVCVWFTVASSARTP